MGRQTQPRLRGVTPQPISQERLAELYHDPSTLTMEEITLHELKKWETLKEVGVSEQQALALFIKKRLEAKRIREEEKARRHAKEEALNALKPDLSFSDYDDLKAYMEAWIKENKWNWDLVTEEAIINFVDSLEPPLGRE